MNAPTIDFATATDPLAYEHLHEHLAERAQAQGLLDVAYRTVDSPLGSLLLAATGAGVVRIAFERQDHDAALDELARKVSPRVLRAPARLEEVARELEEYFAGRRRRFDVRVDLRLASGFGSLVLGVLQRIEFGATLSYAGVAGQVGNPRAVRAVGTACARNPVPLVVPCHRVVRSDGSSGQYAGGAEAKGRLLDLERGVKVGS